jgi:hypothetical protein
VLITDGAPSESFMNTQMEDFCKQQGMTSDQCKMRNIMCEKIAAEIANRDGLRGGRRKARFKFQSGARSFAQGSAARSR